MNNKKVSTIQVYAVVICLIINMLDGFDLLAIAFTADAISAEWDIGPKGLGMLFSSSLVGMILGAFILAPAGDVFGRRPQIITCLFIISFGMLCSGVSESVIQLMVFRFLTGIGVGGILPSINTMVSEYSGPKWRNFSLSLMHIGYPLGVTIGGIASVVLIGEYGWRSVFLLGGSLTLIVALLVLIFLPESLDFLLGKQPKSALLKANKLLVRLNRETLDTLPELVHSSSKTSGIALLLSREYMRSNLLLWGAFFMCMMTQYFLVSWMPKILINAGMSTGEGISAGVVMSVGGMAGMLVLGVVASRFELTRIVQGYYGIAVLAMILFGVLNLDLNALLVLAFIIGFVLYGGIIGLYMIGAWLYPSTIRNSGVGWAIGIGRFGAVLGPYLAGIFIDSGMEKGMYFTLFSIPLLVCFFATGAMKVKTTASAS